MYQFGWAERIIVGSIALIGLAPRHHDVGT